MKFATLLFRLLLVASAGLLSGCKAESGPPQHVFIISLDGGNPSVMQQSRMPVLQGMVKEGAHSWKAQTIHPSITLPSHVSMLTGVPPSVHQVLWNDWQPARGLIDRSSVFRSAKEKGLKTALFAGKEKFNHLNVPARVDHFELHEAKSYNPAAPKAMQIAEAAARHIAQHKPNVTFIHFPETDLAGHAHGWGSAEQIAAFEMEDRALGIILDAIKKAGIAGKSVVIVSADHGGIGKGHGGPTPDEMTIPWVIWGAGVKPGHSIAAPINTCDTAATSLHLLGLSIPAEWQGKPVLEAFVASR